MNASAARTSRLRTAPAYPECRTASCARFARMRHLCVAVLGGILSATAISHAQQNAQVLDVPGGGKIRVVTVATGLFHPWSVAFTPDGGVLVAERSGKLRLMR